MVKLFTLFTETLIPQHSTLLAILNFFRNVFNDTEIYLKNV